MRKIDAKSHRRFIAALELISRDMDTLGFEDNADDLIVSRDELDSIYTEYRRRIKELNSIIGEYHDVFEEKHTEYVNANRLRQKEKTRLLRKVEAKKDKNKITRRDVKKVRTA